MKKESFYSGIPELDTLLGKDYEKTEEKNYNKLILIKGGPGSGKTTLGLQILNNHLKRNKSSNNRYNAAYVSLELEPKVSYEYASRCYNFLHLNDIEPNFFLTTREELKESLENFYNPQKSHPPKLSDVIFDCLKNRNNQKLKNDNSYKIIFFDSLNVLIDFIHSIVDKQVISERDIIKSISEIDRTSKKDDNAETNTIFLFSVEYHPSFGHSKLEISESFLCDTEILLTTEPIFASKERSISNISAIGYNIEGDNAGKKVNEYRTFCRVLKTRFSNHQIRRCSYDLVSGRGLVFYDSYPGDGHVSLFYENSKQEEAWNNFFIEDIPHQFPALRYEKFDRKQMQQNFSNRRRYLHMPERTDLYLSSYDNYWIHWFTNIERKAVIREFIKDESESFKSFPKEDIKYLEPLINFIHSFFISDFLNLNSKTEDLTNDLELSEKKFIRFKKRSFYIAVKTDKEYAIDLLKIESIENALEIKSFNIENIEELVFSNLTDEKIELRKIKIEKNNSAIIFRSTKGLLILIISNTYKCTKIIWTNFWHQKIEFKTYGQNDYVLYDARYNVVNKSINKIEPVNFKQTKCNSVFTVSGSNSRFKIYKGKDSLDKILADIDLKNNSKKNNSGDLLASDLVYKCFNCICLDHLYQYRQDELGKELIRELKDRRGNDCPYKISTDYIPISDEKICHWYKCLPKEQEINPKIFLDKTSMFNEFISLIVSNRIKIQKGLNKKILDQGVDNSDEDTLKLFESVMKIFNKDNLTLKNDFIHLYLKLLRHSENKSFLTPIGQADTLKLFGERKSTFIKELTTRNSKNNRPIQFKHSLFGLYNKESYLSIPYNANVGIFVYRKDILNDFYDTIIKDKKKRDDYILKVNEIYLAQKEGIEKFFSDQSNNAKQDFITQINEIIEYSILNRYPKTWEEIFAIYSYYKEKKCPKELVLDVKTADTYYCTFLELIWNCGGDFSVQPDYTFSDQKNKNLLHAFSLLAYLYYSGILPENSSTQAEVFVSRYNSINPWNKKSNDWIFGRFWYSTFVELFNAKKQDKVSKEESFLWNPTKINELGLMPMPVTLSKIIKKVKNLNEVEHCAAWGDWHLGITHGSENMKLGREIINHLMSSRKIIENAYSNAILPTTEDFYKLFKNTNCFSPLRRNNIIMPSSTYKEIRYKYFRHAQSRSQVFDYRHSMVELNTIIKYIENIAIRDRVGMEMPTTIPEYMISEIYNRISRAIEGINGLIFMNNS